MGSTTPRSLAFLLIMLRWSLFRAALFGFASVAAYGLVTSHKHFS